MNNTNNDKIFSFDYSLWSHDGFETNEVGYVN